MGGHGHRYGSCTARAHSRDERRRSRGPGIAALAAAAARTGNEVIVVAPYEDCSGAAQRSVRSTAVTESSTGPSRSKAAEGVPVYGVDGPPALGVILACVGGFGRRPDIVLSGINHGVNVGRSALHSGTIGAVLTAAQFGIRGLATSIRYGPDPVPGKRPRDLAELLVPVIAACAGCDCAQPQRAGCRAGEAERSARGSHRSRRNDPFGRRTTTRRQEGAVRAHGRRPPTGSPGHVASRPRGSGFGGAGRSWRPGSVGCGRPSDRA